MKTLLAILLLAFAGIQSNATQIVASGHQDWIEVEIIAPGTGDATFSELIAGSLVQVSFATDTVSFFWGYHEGTSGNGIVSDTFQITSPYQAANIFGSDATEIRDTYRGVFVRYGFRDFTIPDSNGSVCSLLGGFVGLIGMKRMRR